MPRKVRPAIATLLGFRIERELGRGASGRVYAAWQFGYRRAVALKLVEPALADDPAFRERFIAIGQAVQRLRHRHLLTLHEVGERAGMLYAVSEILPGGSLRERIARAPLRPEHALAVAVDVARALQHLHAAGIVHRDVASGNVLFRDDGAAVLGDYGVAARMEVDDAVADGRAVGTPATMSPEQAAGAAPSPCADLYSLGVLLFEMLTGRLPYEADDPATLARLHASHPLPVLPPDRGWLQPLIDGTLAKEPAQRFDDAGAFIAAVEQVLASAPQAFAGPKRPVRRAFADEPAEPVIRRGRWHVAAWVALALLTASLAAWLGLR